MVVKDERFVEGFKYCCDACGAVLWDGWWLGWDRHACSWECAVKVYGGDEEALRADMEDEEDYNCIIYCDWLSIRR